MLTADRPALAKRAVECFRSQTYTPRFMLQLDTGAFTRDSHFSDPRNLSPDRDPFGCITVEGRPELKRQAIGELRNKSNALALHHFPDASILIHWDDDDYSHPNRIAEQVSLLQSSGADAVGYQEILFWREPIDCELIVNEQISPMKAPGQAWLYRGENANYPPGTSLCYWRKTWERKPFPATSFGEDLQFCTGLKVCGVSANPIDDYPPMHHNEQPRMIARIHAGNTSTGYAPAKMQAEARKPNPVWRRVPAWDDYCRRTME
jgi:hypothetical protein